MASKKHSIVTNNSPLLSLGFIVVVGLLTWYRATQIYAKYTAAYQRIYTFTHSVPYKRALRKFMACKNPPPAKLSETDIYRPPTLDEKDCTFANGYLKIKELDHASCRRLAEFTIVDRNNVYTHNFDRASGVSMIYRVEDKADSKTLVYLGSGYYRDANNLFYDVDGEFRIIEGIDLDSVQILATHVIKDKDHVYFSRGYGKAPDKKVFEYLDTDTFEAMGNDWTKEYYFKDKHGIYVSTVAYDNAVMQKIEGVDMESFRLLPQHGLAKDKNHVYKGKDIIPDIDAPSFEILNGGYSRDKYFVYVGVGYPHFTKILEEADPCTFEVIDYKGQYHWGGYAKDKTHVYFRADLVEGADVASFTVAYKNDPGPDDWDVYDKNYEYMGKYRKEDAEKLQ